MNRFRDLFPYTYAKSQFWKAHKEEWKKVRPQREWKNSRDFQILAIIALLVIIATAIVGNHTTEFWLKGIQIGFIILATLYFFITAFEAGEAQAILTDAYFEFRRDKGFRFKNRESNPTQHQHQDWPQDSELEGKD